MEHDLCCEKCGEVMFRITENGLSPVGKVMGKCTEYDTSHGKKLEIECKCPVCEAIHTLYFSQKREG